MILVAILAKLHAMWLTVWLYYLFFCYAHNPISISSQMYFYLLLEIDLGQSFILSVLLLFLELLFKSLQVLLSRGGHKWFRFHCITLKRNEVIMISWRWFGRLRMRGRNSRNRFGLRDCFRIAWLFHLRGGWLFWGVVRYWLWLFLLCVWLFIVMTWLRCVMSVMLSASCVVVVLSCFDDICFD